MYSKFDDPCITNFEWWTLWYGSFWSCKAVKAVIKSTLARDLKLKAIGSGRRLGLESLLCCEWTGRFRADEFIKAVSQGRRCRRPKIFWWFYLTVEEDIIDRKTALQTAITVVHVYQIWLTLVRKRRKLGPSFRPTQNAHTEQFGRSCLRG